MFHKNARSLPEIARMEKQPDAQAALQADLQERGLFIRTLSQEDLGLDIARCGLHGSPTKVKKVEAVVLAGGEYETIEATREGLGALVEQLVTLENGPRSAHPT